MSLYERKGGKIFFPLRSNLNRKSGKADSIWYHQFTSVLIMFFCLALDLVLLYQLFSVILYDSPIIRFFSIAVLGLGMDVAPIYLGIELKKKTQKLPNTILPIFILAFAFILSLAVNFMLRLVFRNVALPQLTENVEETFAYAFAIAAGCFPIVSSAVSFAVSYALADPLRTKMLKLKKEQIDLEEAIVEIEAILTDYEMDENLEDRMAQMEEEYFIKQKEMIIYKGMNHSQYVRERLKILLQDPNSNNILSQPIMSEFKSKLFEDLDSQSENRKITVLVNETNQRNTELEEAL